MTTDLKQLPERTYMTRDDALKIARSCAYAKCHTHGYLPRTAQEAADWQPHEWVLDAIRWNALAQSSGADSQKSGEGVAEGSLRFIAKRNLRKMIESGSTDTKTMLLCLEELS